MNKFLLIVFFTLFQMVAAADTAVAVFSNDDKGDLGMVANDLTSPIVFVEHVFNGMSVVLGMYLLMSAITRYKKFRDNPQESPISFVLIWLLLGLALILLPFVHQLTTMASHYTGVNFVETS